MMATAWGCFSCFFFPFFFFVWTQALNDIEAGNGAESARVWKGNEDNNEDRGCYPMGVWGKLDRSESE